MPRFKTLQKRFANESWPEFKKNKPTFSPVEGQAPRRRVAKSLPSRQDSLPAYRLTRDFLLSLINAGESENPRLCPTPNTPPEADVYQYTEKMLRSISHLVKGIFDLGRSSVSPSHDASSSWQLVYDKCLGLTGIGAISVLPDKLWFLWHKLLEQLESAAPGARGMAFLTQLWRVCACLLNTHLFIRVKSNSSVVLGIFLSRLRWHFLATMSQRDDLVVIVDSILGVLVSAPLHLKIVLGIGCLRTTDMLGRMVGCSHPLVLKLTSSRCQHWKPDPLARRNHLERYKPLLDSMNLEKPTQDDIEVLYDYTVSQRYINPKETPQYAALLHKLAQEQCRAIPGTEILKYSQISRALAYSAEILAVCQLDPVTGMGEHNIRERNQAFQYVAKAIELLQHGDLECQVRAVQLSKRLSIWFKTYFPERKTKDKSRCSKEMDQRKQTSKILANIKELPPPKSSNDSQGNGDDSGWGSRQGSTNLENIEGKGKKPSRNNRWRRKVRDQQKMALHGITQEGKAERTAIERIKGPRAPRVDKTRKKKGPAQTLPTNLNQTCCDCAETFTSRNLLFRHLAEGCRQQHPWSERYENMMDRR